jgi:hypothetical protein
VKPIFGNPCDGSTIIDPFETLDEATEWAEENLMRPMEISVGRLR